MASLEKDNKGPENENTGTLLLDVREKAEYEVSHIAGAKFINFDDPYSVQFRDTTSAIGRISRNNASSSKLNIYAYCAVGMRASLFIRAFQKH